MATAEARSGEFGGSDSEVTTGSIGAINRQPSVFDYSQSNQFKVFFPIFPTTEWFVVRANIPDVTLGQSDQYTPIVNIAVVGDHITYGPFNMTFIVDEKLHNYMEMYNWVKNIGFPYSGEEQFNKLGRRDNLDREKIIRNETDKEICRCFSPESGIKRMLIFFDFNDYSGLFY